jgi:hypothetical protein
MMVRVINQMGRLILISSAYAMNSRLKNVSVSSIENWFDKKQFFFILSIGRSGSMFLANLLNKATHHQVLHEPTRLDFLAYAQAFYGLETKFDYLSEFRKKFIYLHNYKQDFIQYGEVNSILRRHSGMIRENIPNVRIFYLVRDGRDVVRSMMARRTYTYKDPNSFIIKPKQGSEFLQNWSRMDRFERICWYWWVENQYLIETIGRPILFEKLIEDYDYFYESLLVPLQIDISREIWRNEINQPKNPTVKHVIPPWEKWTAEKTEKFDRICSDLMKKLGYYE